MNAIPPEWDLASHVLAGSLIGPALTHLTKRTGLDARAWAGVNLVVTAVLYIAGWAIFSGAQADFRSWLIAGFAAAGIGQAGNNIWTKVLKPAVAADPPTSPPPA